MSSLRTKDIFTKGGLGPALFAGKKRKKREGRRKRERERFAAGQNLRSRQAGLAERTLLQSSTPGSAQQRTLLGG